MNEKVLEHTVHRKEPEMLYTIAVILIILWLLGFFAGGMGLGAFIHLLLVIAVILIIFSLISGNSKI